MFSGSLPRPIAYALSIVIVLLGVSVSYQVFKGSSFSYEGSLGSIQLGQGDDATTLAEYIDQSQEALAAAQSSIAMLIEENKTLRQRIERYRELTQRAEKMASQGETRELQAEVSVLNAVVEIDQSAAASQDLSLDNQRQLLNRQMMQNKKLQQIIENQTEP